MFKRLSYLHSIALLGFLCGALPIHQVNAQSIELEWQQTASGKQGNLSQFDQYAVRGDFQVALLGLERRNYHSGNTGAQSVSNLDHLKVGVQYYTEITNDYALWPRMQIMAGYDEHISSDSLTYNPQLVGIRHITDDISIVAGAGALLHTAQNQYYPVFGLVWEQSERSRWSGNITVPQGDIAYRLNDQWLAEAGLKWQTRYYQTSKNLAESAFIRTQDILLSFGSRTHFNSGMRLSARLTYALQRDVRLYTSDTNVRTSESPASGMGFRLVIGYDF
ncbi:MAG: hypothetical protein JJU03_08880 [Idiomarina sp.]|nr:hypothetical protein [Idiomarina sp.]